MTANVQFILQRESDVLTVPNAALRFEPAVKEEKASTKTATNAVTSALTGGKAGKSEPGKNPFGHPTGGQSFYSGEDGEKSAVTVEKKNEKTLWFENDDGNLSSVKVYAGISDGIKTVVSAVDSGVNLENLRVILREAEQ